MAKRKSKPRKATTPLAESSNVLGELDQPVLNAEFFPFARYTSLVFVHATLLAFTALFLPRTTFLFQLTTPVPDPSQMTSRDRPQHPFLEALTINPVSTLACICAGGVVLQGWWGGWVRGWWIEFSLEGSDAVKEMERAFLQQKKIASLGGSWLATFATSFVVHAILVLFGAPTTSHILHTYLLALLVSVLTVFTPAYTIGVPSIGPDTASLVNRLTWVRLFAEFSIRNPVERAIVYPAVGTVLGCWVGVFPIALDWDRPWQAWPLTPMFGAIVGYIIASIYALTASATRYLADEDIHSEQEIKAKTS